MAQNPRRTRPSSTTDSPSPNPSASTPPNEPQARPRGEPRPSDGSPNSTDVLAEPGHQKQTGEMLSRIVESLNAMTEAHNALLTTVASQGLKHEAEIDGLRQMLTTDIGRRLTSLDRDWIDGKLEEMAAQLRDQPTSGDESHPSRSSCSGGNGSEGENHDGATPIGESQALVEIAAEVAALRVEIGQLGSSVDGSDALQKAGVEVAGKIERQFDQSKRELQGASDQASARAAKVVKQLDASLDRAESLRAPLTWVTVGRLAAFAVPFLVALMVVLQFVMGFGAMVGVPQLSSWVWAGFESADRWWAKALWGLAGLAWGLAIVGLVGWAGNWLYRRYQGWS